MQIRTISLYGKNGKRRDVKLNPSGVNIITGASKKGKSSLIDIIEYCLGASKCTVAEGHIQDNVDWYAVVLIFPDTEVFIARKAPKTGYESSSSCDMRIANEIQIPEKPELEESTNVDSVSAYLTSKIGIPEQETEVPEGNTRATTKLAFKHSLYYLFQAQDEIATKKVLFHRQAEEFVGQNIKDTLPYFIGAAEDDRLAELEKLRGLKREEKRILKQIKEAESLRSNGLKVGHDLLAEASAVGLYKGGVIINDDELLYVLRLINQWRASVKEAVPENDTYQQLDREYQELRQKKSTIRSRITAANDYEQSIGGFATELGEQALRLKSIDLYKSINQEGVCSVCEQPHESQNRIDTIMASSVATLNAKLDGVARSKPRVTEYLDELRRKDSELAESIKKTRSVMDAILKEEVSEADLELLNDRRSRVVGRISMYLDSLDLGSDINPLQQRLRELEPQIRYMEEKLDPEAMKNRLEAQLSCIGEDMTAWARELNLEHSEHLIRLDASKLTVVAETPKGRIPLHRMGSGENWVGYHLVSYMALAKWFIQQDRPVGCFVFFDQPTQVYFPSDQSVTGDLKEIPLDEDRKAVEGMFRWILKVAEELAPALQVIITDHADIDEDWFQSCVIKDEKWRGDKALIPLSWYSQGA